MPCEACREQRVGQGQAEGCVIDPMLFEGARDMRALLSEWMSTSVIGGLDVGLEIKTGRKARVY